MKLSILVFLFMPLFAYSQKYYPNLYLPEQDRQLAFLAYCDSMRNGFTGSMILCIDKNFQPVDSVLVGLIPYSFKGSDSVYAITKFHMRTDKQGFCKSKKFVYTLYRVVGIKDNILYDLLTESSGPAKQGSTQSVEDYVLQAQKPIPKKKGIRLIMHNKDSIKKK